MKNADFKQPASGDGMCNEGDLLFPEYARPRLPALLGVGCSNARMEPRYHYSKALFRDFDIFNLFALDGGAFFFAKEHLGGASESDFLNAYRSGKLLAPWRNLDAIDWDMVATRPPDRTDPCRERYVWLNRLYFLLPLAHQFFLTGETQWADAWFQHFASWSDHHGFRPHTAAQIRALWLANCRRKLKKAVRPLRRAALKSQASASPVATPGPESLRGRDMQLSWPLLVLIHSVFLLKNHSAFAEDHWRKIYAAVFHCSRRLYGEARVEWILGLGEGNHFLHKGVALLFAGVLYPEFAHAQRLVELGRRIVDQHARRETTPDGFNIEKCPSYSYFIARLHLEAHLLLQANGLRPIPGLADTVAREYQLLHQTESPGGEALVINESYPLDAIREREIISRLMPALVLPPKDSLFFASSSFVVLRHGPLTIFVDGDEQELRHHHQGKPSLLVFHGQHEVLVDSGCCNYDRVRERNLLACAQSHNVVLVEPAGVSSVTGQEVPIKVKLFDFECRGDSKSISMVRQARRGGFHYSWRRTVTATDSEIEIRDEIRPSARARCALLLHLPRNSHVTLGEGGRSHVASPNWELEVEQEIYPSKKQNRFQTTSQDELACVSFSRVLRFCAEGDHVAFRTVLRFRVT